MCGRVHTKTGLVTKPDFIQSCCVLTTAIKACWNRARTARLQHALETDVYDSRAHIGLCVKLPTALHLRKTNNEKVVIIQV